MTPLKWSQLLRSTILCCADKFLSIKGILVHQYVSKASSSCGVVECIILSLSHSSICHERIFIKISVPCAINKKLELFQVRDISVCTYCLGLCRSQYLTNIRSAGERIIYVVAGHLTRSEFQRQMFI